MEEMNMNQTAENAADGASGVQPEAPKKNGKKLGVIIGLAAAAVIAAAAAFMMTRKDPKTVVVDAFKDAAGAEEASPLEEIFGWEELYKNARTAPYQANVEFQLDNISDESMASLATGKLWIDSKAVPENRASSMVMGIGYGGMDLLKLQAYLDDSSMILAVPELSSKAFTVNYADDLAGQMAASEFFGPLMEQSGMDPSGFTEYMQYIQDVSYSGEQILDLSALWQRYRDGSKAVENLKAAMTVEKIDGKTQTFNGKEEKTDGYQVMVPKDAFAAFLRETKEFMMADETFKADFLKYMDQIANIYSMYGVTFNGEELPGGEELWTRISDALDDGLEDMGQVIGDINAAVYVTKAGQLASYETKTTVALDKLEEMAGAEETADESEGTEADVLNVTISGIYEGGYSRKANSSTTVMLENEGQQISMILERAGTYDKAVYDDSLNIRLVGDGSDLSLLLKGSYTVADGSYSMSAEVGNNGENIASLIINGVVSDLVKGKSFDASIDSAQLTADMGYDSLNVDLSGRYAVVPLEGELDMPEGEPLDAIAATEEDWQNVSMEIFAGLMGMISQMQ